MKRDVWEGGHRVPMIVRWPGVVAAGVVSDALVGQVDLMATIAGLLEYELPRDQAEDSFDQMPVWLREEGSVRDFLVHNTFAKSWGIRRGKWLFLNKKGGGHTRVPDWVAADYPANPRDVMLCDLERDLGQRTNLSERYPEVVVEMQALLANVRSRGHSAPRLLEK